MPSAYYDIDNILSEEELVPCTTLLDFSHLAHLDPDCIHRTGTDAGDVDGGDGSKDGSGGRKRTRRARPPRHLPEGSRIKMPLWSVEKWATLGFVRIGLPRHFSRRARERLEADPSSADLRSRNERFFSSGMLLVSLVERCSSVLAAAASSSSGRRGAGQNSRRGAHAAAMEQVSREAAELRRTLVVTYTGERMRRIFDWTLSSIDDDVTAFTRRLTELETRLFRRGASAAAAHAAWKSFGSRRIAVSETALRSAAMRSRAAASAAGGGGGPRTVSPEQQEKEQRAGRGGSSAAGRKRSRLQ